MKHIRYLILVLALAFAVTGCYKDPALTYEESDMTITHYDQDFNFTAYNNFIMPDSAILKTNYLSDSQIENFYKSGGTGDQTKKLLKEKFVSFGYAEVTDIEDADFIALPAVMMMETTEVILYNPGWWWGYPGYGWGWGYYKSTEYYYGWYPVYPWYPSGIPIQVHTFNGTVAYAMVDAASYLAVIEFNTNLANDSTYADSISPVIEVNWQSTIEGYTTDDAEYNEERAVRGTDEAFAQSPYLRK